jgi:hypothetical protein
MAARRGGAADTAISGGPRIRRNTATRAQPPRGGSMPPKAVPPVTATSAGPRIGRNTATRAQPPRGGSMPPKAVPPV